MFMTRKNINRSFSIRLLLLSGFVAAGAVLPRTGWSQFGGFKFENISAYNGLSQNTITSIAQDQYGFMWFGTFNGLNRYDGYDFRVYLMDRNNPRSLSSSRITDLFSDARGNLWIWTIDGIDRYNYETDDFDHFTINQLSQQILEGFERRNRPQIFKYENHRFRFYYNQERTFTYTNLLTGDSTKDVVNLDDPYGIRDNYLISMFIDRYHSLWVGSFSSGVYYADLQRKKFNHYLLSGENTIINNIRAIHQYAYQKDTLWLGTRDQGLIEFDRRTKKILRHYQYDPLRKNSLVYNDIRKIFQDSKGFLWIGTKGGVDRFDPVTERFFNIMKGTGNDNRYYIFDIYEDHYGAIWIATFAGLHQYDDRTNSVIRYGEEEGVYADNSIRFIREDNQLNLWIGTEVGGLTMLKRKPVTGDKAAFVSVRFSNDPEDDNSLSNNRLYSVCKDIEGTMWFGSAAGLNRYNPAGNNFTVISKNNGLPDDMILGILSDQKGHIWVSHKRGISKINKQSLEVINYSLRDGLQDNEFNEDAYWMNPVTGEMFFGGPKGFNSFYADSIVENDILPVMMITDLIINGETVNINDTVNGKVLLKTNIFLTKEITLTPKEKSLSLVFAGLNYANPGNHKYAYMMEGFDLDWIYTDAKMRRASYTNLSPGSYTFKVKACNSDGMWSDNPAVLKIIVLPPFWMTWWFRLLLIVFIAGTAALFFYYRISHFRKLNIMLEEKVSRRTRELKESNEKITAQYQEIIDQNKVILHKNEEITSQAELLEEQKAKIEKAFSELDIYRNNLEQLVEERTKELLLAKEKAEESDRLKSSFLANLSHEIRTPLNAIIGFSSMLGEEELTDAERDLYNSIIRNGSNNLLELINDILDISQIEAGQLKIAQRPVLISTLADNVMGLYNLFMQRLDNTAAKKLKFRVNIDEELLHTEIITDPFRLEQIISNLISNAIKFTDQGTIEFGCTKMPGNKMLEFYVKDTGIGIKEEHQTIIFERFRKLEDDITQVRRGTGLGLAISSQLVSLLGGAISLNSVPGKGSVFYFTLPLVASEAPDKAVQTGIRSNAIPDLSHYNILVAEDDLSNFLYLEKLLKKTGAGILHANNGQEVLDILQQSDRVRLILMDIKMPVMDGIKSIREIKKKNIKVPVIAQTAYAFPDEIEKIRQEGFDNLITKPIVAENLYRILTQLLA